MRKRVWGLYDYEFKVWIQSNDSPPRRLRFFSGCEAFNAAEHHGANIQPRPFYIVSKTLSLDPKVQAVVDAARKYVDNDLPGTTNNRYNLLTKAVRTLDGKY